MTTRKIIGLSGFAQSGKDSVGKILVSNYGFKRLAFADAVRNGLYEINPAIAAILETEPQKFWSWFKRQPKITHTKVIRVKEIVDSLGWEKAKTTYNEIRELLQRYGTEGGRDIHGQDCWTNIIKREIEAEPQQDFVITDVRFPNEKILIEKLGGKVYKVIRDGVKSVNTHISDKDLEGVTKFITNNGSMKDLETEADKLCSRFNALYTTN